MQAVILRQSNDNDYVRNLKKNEEVKFIEVATVDEATAVAKSLDCVIFMKSFIEIPDYTGTIFIEKWPGQLVGDTNVISSSNTSLFVFVDYTPRKKEQPHHFPVKHFKLIKTIYPKNKYIGYYDEVPTEFLGFDELRIMFSDNQFVSVDGKIYRHTNTFKFPQYYELKTSMVDLGFCKTDKNTIYFNDGFAVPYDPEYITDGFVQIIQSTCPINVNTNATGLVAMSYTKCIEGSRFSFKRTRHIMSTIHEADHWISLEEFLKMYVQIQSQH